MFGIREFCMELFFCVVWNDFRSNLFRFQQPEFFMRRHISCFGVTGLVLKSRVAVKIRLSL